MSTMNQKARGTHSEGIWTNQWRALRKGCKSGTSGERRVFDSTGGDNGDQGTFLTGGF